MEERFQRFFSSFSSDRPIRLLDVGCGSGTFLEAAKALGHDVWGIDFDPISVQRAKERSLTQVYCQALDEFLDQHGKIRFDHITAFDVIEHLVDPMSVLRCLLGMLVPGGTLTVTVPNRRRLLANQMVSDFPPHHFFRFDSRSLVRTLERAGFENVDAEVFQYGYVGPTAINALVKSVRRFAFSGERTPAAASQATQATLSDENPRSTGDLKDSLKRCITKTVAPSKQIERLLGRGFKVFATAHRPLESSANDAA